MYKLFIIAIIVVCSCNNKAGETVRQSAVTEKDTKVDPSVDVVSGNAAVAFTYDLDHPAAKWQMPAELFEISGNTWIDKDHLLVIEDLHPVLYLLNISKPAVSIEKKISFSDQDKVKFDIEDVTIANNTVYALWSHGSVYKINNWQTTPQISKTKTFLSKGNNAEGLCYDPVTRNLLVALKEESASQEAKKSTKAVYEYDVAGDSLKDAPFMMIKKKELKTTNGEKIKFFPSAIAVHPVTHDVYVLSTRDTKCMAVFSHDGQFKALQYINAALLPQPEGITFSPEGTMFISSEGKKDGAGVICRFDGK